MNNFEKLTFDIRDHISKLTVVKEKQREWHCRCPICNDGGFKIEKSTGKYGSFKCHCMDNPENRNKIVKMLQPFEQEEKVTKKLVERQFPYETTEDDLQVRVDKWFDEQGEKQFSQKHRTGNKGRFANKLPEGWSNEENWGKVKLFKSENIAKAKAAKKHIFVVEGEECVEALGSLGFLATTNIQGSSKWCEAWAEQLRGCKVVLCPDRDKVGVKHMERIEATIADKATSIKWLYAPPSQKFWQDPPDFKGLDVYDWIYRTNNPATKEAIIEAVGEKLKPVLKLPDVTGASSTSVTYDALLKLINDIWDSYPDNPARRAFELHEIATRTGKPLKLLENIRTFETREKELTFQSGSDFFNSEIPEPEWLVNGLIAATDIMVLSASAGAGKSTFTYNLLKSIVFGIPFCDRLTKKGKVLILQKDEGMHSSRNRLQKLGLAQAGNQWAISFNADFSNIAAIEQQIEQQQYDLVICDSLTILNRHCGSKQIEIDYADPIYDLRRIVNKYNCAFIIIHHHNKGGTIRGTTAIEDAADEVVKLEKIGEETNSPRIFKWTKSRHGLGRNKYEVKLNNETGEITMELYVNPEERQNGFSGKDHVKASVFELLNSSHNVFYSRKELLEHPQLEGVKDTSLRRALEELSEEEGSIKQVRAAIETSRGLRAAYFWGIPKRSPIPPPTQKNDESGMENLLTLEQQGFDSMPSFHANSMPDSMPSDFGMGKTENLKNSEIQEKTDLFHANEVKNQLGMDLAWKAGMESNADSSNNSAFPCQNSPTGIGGEGQGSGFGVGKKVYHSTKLRYFTSLGYNPDSQKVLADWTNTNTPEWLPISTTIKNQEIQHIFTEYQMQQKQSASEEY